MASRSPNAVAVGLLRSVLSELDRFKCGQIPAHLSPSGDNEELFGPFRAFDDDVAADESAYQLDDTKISWPNMEVLRQQIASFLNETKGKMADAGQDHQARRH